MSIEISLTKLRQAQAIFEDFRQGMVTDRDKAGAIQAFEFCYELAWKTMKRVLSLHGLETGSPKDTFRKAAQEHLIDDPEQWFDFQKKRNLTVYTYELNNITVIIESFDDFSHTLSHLIERIEQLIPRQKSFSE